MSVKNQLVKIAVSFNPVKPTLCNLHVGVGLDVIPIGVGCLWELDVCCFTKGVLAGVCASDFDVELIAAVAG